MKTSGERLRNLRETRGLSAAELAAAVGRSESAVRNQENGTNGIPATLAKKYAAILGVTPAAILYGEEVRAPVLGLLPVRGAVQAGAWLEVDVHDQRNVEMRAAAKDQRFPLADQWLSIVHGDSMNDLKPSGIFDGDTVQCVDAISIDYQPRTGDIVEVERIRFQGRERELTLKQVEVTPKGVVLWPRSTNARWQQPIRILEDGDAGDDVEVRIRGWVIKLIRDL